MAEEIIHMPSRFYKLYAHKIREMPSLKTDDIQGAKPTKFNYAKSDILEQYHANRIKSQPKKDTSNLNYWSALHPPFESYQAPQSIHQTSYIFHPTESYLPQNLKGTPSLFRAARPPMQSERKLEYANGYQPTSNLQSPQAANYSSINQYNSMTSRDPQPRTQVRDSLDTLQYEAARKDPYRQNLPYEQQQEQNDFRQKWVNMYGVEPSENLVNARGNIRDTSSLIAEQNSNMFKSSSSPAIYDTRSYNYKNTLPHNFNQEHFEKNMARFFGVEETGSNQQRQRQAYDQYQQQQQQQQQYYSRPALPEMNQHNQYNSVAQQPIMRSPQRQVRF